MKVCEIPDINVSEPMWLAAKTAHVLSNRVGEKKELAKKKWKKPTKKQTKKQTNKKHDKIQPILRILPIYGNIFGGRNFPKQYHSLNTVFLQDPLW